MVCRYPALDVLRPAATKRALMAASGALDFRRGSRPGAHRHHSGFHAILHAILRPHALALCVRSRVRSFLANMGFQRTPIHGTILLGIRRWNRQSSLAGTTRRLAGSGRVSEVCAAGTKNQRSRICPDSGRAVLPGPQRLTGTSPDLSIFFAGSPRLVLD